MPNPFASLTLILTGVHVAGVLASSPSHRENPVCAVLTRSEAWEV